MQNLRFTVDCGNEISSSWSKYAESVGDFDPDSLNANIAGQVEYNDEVSKNEDIYDILPSLKGSSWDGKVYIKDGILFFDGLSDKEQEIADDVTKKDDEDTKKEATDVYAVLNPKSDIYTNKKVDVSMFVDEKPSGYAIEYKVGENGTWKKYTTAVSQTFNTTIYMRLYNSTLKETIGNQTQVVVGNVDKLKPIKTEYSITSIKNVKSATIPKVMKRYPFSDTTMITAT